MREACAVTSGYQSFVDNSLDGQTPVAAFFYAGTATADNTATAHGSDCWGAATGASNQWCVTTYDQHGVTPTVVGRRVTSSECIRLLTSSGAIDGEAEFVEFIPNGVKVNWTNAPSAARLIHIIFIAGSRAQAYAGTFTAHATVDTAVDVTDPGFTPDVVLMLCHGADFTDTNRGSRYISLGVAVNDGSDTQRAVMVTSANDVDAGAVTGIFSESYATGQMTLSAGAYVWAGEIGSFDTSGFSCTSRVAGAGGDVVAYLAFGWGGALGVNLRTVTTPTSTGSQSETGTGFTPQALIVGLSHLATAETQAQDDTAGVYGLGSAGANSYCLAIASEDGSNPTDTQSRADDVVVNLPEDDGTSGHLVSFTSFDSGGWTWNFTTTRSAACLWWALAIEQGSATNIPVVIHHLRQCIAA